MSETMAKGWEAPQESPSAADAVLLALEKMSPRDGAILTSAIMLVALHDGKKYAAPDRVTYVELVKNLLDTVKHTAEMDLMSLLLACVPKMQEEFGDKIPASSLLAMLAQGAQVAKKASLRSLDRAQNLVSLCEIEENSKEKSK